MSDINRILSKMRVVKKYVDLIADADNISELRIYSDKLYAEYVELVDLKIHHIRSRCLQEESGD